MEPEPVPVEHDATAPGLRVLLQAGLGLLLTAGLLPLLTVAAQLSQRFWFLLHATSRLASGAEPVVFLLVFALAGALAARLSATLAGNPRDGFGACGLATVLGGWQLATVRLGPHTNLWLVATWPLGLALGCELASRFILRRRRRQAAHDEVSSG